MHRNFYCWRTVGNKGFAAFTYLIFVGIIFSVVATAFMVYLYDVADSQRSQVEQKQEQIISQSLKDYYQKNAFKIDQNSGNCLYLNGDCIKSGTDGYLKLARAINLPRDDAWGKPYYLCVSRRLTTTFGIPYHDVYVISSGKDYQRGTSCTNNGIVITNKSRGDNDRVVAIDGRIIEGELYNLSLSIANNLSKIIKGYVKGLYVGNNRYANKDYFISSSCDSSVGSGKFGCYTVAPLNQTNLGTVLKLTNSEMKDAWGNYFLFDDYSNFISHRQSPFTARVGVRLPNGNIKWIVFAYTL